MKPTSSTTPLVHLVDTPCWYHGSASKFQDWQVPPPRKDPLLVAHTAIFFTTERDFASRAGREVSVSSIKPESKILDCTIRSDGLEKLRLKTSQHATGELFENFKEEYWYPGWISGDVLRPIANTSGISYLKSLISKQAHLANLSTEDAWTMIQHNATRGLIEHICQCAASLGFDGIFGHEVDRHSHSTKTLARPWLAIFNRSAISAPNWLD
ncbi:hypothetical protein [Pseudomonas fulva]|uniref:Uncharacterized protein n=1 Tax=Pseudomonas fulva (strain 12-X) TaxID=743720 RepID=F6AAT8_PSEF1|nr:hypothetical protein [Pseudomonas fulva]AEF22141.1 hypothetical protein Psefu_2172 [Pseudomonas fulva 12-X]